MEAEPDEEPVSFVRQKGVKFLHREWAMQLYGAMGAKVVQVVRLRAKIGVTVRIRPLEGGSSVVLQQTDVIKIQSPWFLPSCASKGLLCTIHVS